MELYFDVLPYDLLIIIVSKLKKSEFNAFKEIINKDILTNNFYKDLLIIIFNKSFKRNYNWEQVYKGLLNVFNFGFTLKSIKSPIYDLQYDNKLLKCFELNDRLSKGKYLHETSHEYMIKFCKDLTKLSILQSYDINN